MYIVDLFLIGNNRWDKVVFDHLIFVFDSKCLGCVYVQRESKSSDFKGVAGRCYVSTFFTITLNIVA